MLTALSMKVGALWSELDSCADSRALQVLTAFSNMMRNPVSCQACLSSCRRVAG